LNGGAPLAFSLGPDGRLLQKPGDFKINLPYASLQNGANTVIITVMDSAGVAAAETVTVMRPAGKVWPIPFGLAWSTPESLTDSAQVVDGQWSRTSQGARTTATGYDRSIAIGDTVWTDYEVITEFTINKIDSTAEAFSTKNGGPAFGIMMRWVGHTNSPTFNPPVTQPLTGYLPLGALGWYHWRSGFGQSDANRWELLGKNLVLRGSNSDSLNALQYGTKYALRMQVTTNPGSRGAYKLKFWKAGQLEPASWLLSGLESSTDPQYGSLLFLAHFVDVTIGRIKVNPVVGDATPPVIGQIRATPGARSAFIRWGTNEPATDRVVYGTSAVYSDTVTGPDVLRMSHGLFLTGLAPNTQYHYVVISTDGSGNQAVSGDSMFTTTSPKPPTTFVADEFTAPTLDLGRWQWVNPTPPGGASFTKEPTTVTLVVPGGTAHDLWTNGYQVPRLMQAVNDADFTVEVKFNSALGPQFQTQGLVFEQDSANVIRVDLNGNGTQTRSFIASFLNGFSSPVIVADALVGATDVSPLWMRVQREDDAWTVSHSLNGTAWTTVSTFFHAMALQKIGLFAGNAGPTPPAFSSVVDYIRKVTSGSETGVIANLKVLLQGAYARASDSMRTALSSHIPRRQPYGGAPWNYTGNDSVPAVSPSVVDWVLIELRSDTAATSVVDRRAAFVKNDGSVVNLDGTSTVLFPSLPAGDYYVVVHHRNHLAVMSSSALGLSGYTPLYDFTVSQAQARGVNPMKALGTQFGLFSGDANGDGQVTSLDFDQFNPKFRSAATGYEVTDFTLDGQVTSLDFDEFNANFRAAAVTRVPK
jgi:large repetitive protein